MGLDFLGVIEGYQFRPNRIENSGNSSGPNRGPHLILASCRTGQKSRTGANQVGCVGSYRAEPAATSAQNQPRRSPSAKPVALSPG